jgi:DnaJ-class molecular chaperone
MKEVNKAYEVLGDAEFSDCFETLFARPGGRARRAGGAAHVARGTNGASPAAEA